MLLIFLSSRDDADQYDIQSLVADWHHLMQVYLIRRAGSDGKSEDTWYDPGGALASCYGIAEEGLVLIRPDGYLSFRSCPIAASPLHRYLQAHFSLPHA